MKNVGVQELMLSLKRNSMALPGTLEKQMAELDTSTGKLQLPESRRKQEKTLRQVNYQNVRESMDKWLPVVKLNREKDHLNFTAKSSSNVRVNFFPSNSKSALTERIESELQNLKVGSEKQLTEQEQKTLASMPPEEAKDRLREMRKERSHIFYEEMKRKRISKIKSKLYHRIKKRQRVKQQF